MKLDLKIRKGDNRLVVPMDQVKRIVSNPDAETARFGLWNFFQPLSAAEVETHDKHWLKMIIDWQPQGGIALSELARWFSLIELVNGIDETKAGKIELTQYQADLLWERMKHDDFKTDASAPWIEFVMYFTKQGGFHFEKEEPPAGKEEPPDQE